MAAVGRKINYVSHGARSLLLRKSTPSSLESKTTQRQLSRLLCTLRRSVTTGNLHQRSFSTSNHINTIYASKYTELDIKSQSLGEYMLPRFDEFGDHTALVSTILIGRPIQ